jgi:hypothetical protein
MMKSNEPQNTSLLISDGYREEQQKLHEKGNYGTASIVYAPIVSAVIERMGISDLLDYGCGKSCNLAKHLTVKSKLLYQAYDPAVEKFCQPPAPAQMVACIDVLEHIEPQYLDSVLDHLRALAEGVVFLSIDTGPAKKVLSDGRNAHLIQQPMSWWMPKIFERWEVQTLQLMHEHGFFVIGTAKGQIQAVDGSVLSH